MNLFRKLLLFFSIILWNQFAVFSQKNIVKANDANAPLHALQPDYPINYSVPVPSEVKAQVDKVWNYLEKSTPKSLVNEKGDIWSAGMPYNAKLKFAEGDFRPISYEYGVTYSGMLEWYRITNEYKYYSFVEDRLDFISDAMPSAIDFDNGENNHILRGLVRPKALDDIGAMAMAIIKAKKYGYSKNIDEIIRRAEKFILEEEHRLPDNTLVRIRPLKNTLWLDDLYMALPALVQMGNLTGEPRFYEEVNLQFNAYFKRMFNKDLGIYMHGYLEGAERHPEFHWGRANGWALLTACEILEYLPEDSPFRQNIMEKMKMHLNGLLNLQSGSGFWHQLLDKEDSYLETSATAIYTYVIAKGVNKGWLDTRVYGPAAILGWQAVQSKVNGIGQVEGTCVGTGLAWDPAFYYHRPISPYAAHAYGPFLLAGSAIYEMLSNQGFHINDSAIHIKE